jgi:hypothetical protein
MSDNRRVDRADTVHPRRGESVDLPTIMALVVALLILISGWFLFNDLPTFGKRNREGRPATTAMRRGRR